LFVCIQLDYYNIACNTTETGERVLPIITSGGDINAQTISFNKDFELYRWQHKELTNKFT